MLPRFDSGVSGYILGHATVTVHFPIDFKGKATVCCGVCKYFNRSNRYCKLNNEVPEDPERFFGSQCPLEFEEREDNNVQSERASD